MGAQARIRGTLTAMVTPFNLDESLDLDGFVKNLNAQLEAGIVPVVLGTTGEAPQIEEEERIELVKLTVDEAKKYNRNVVVGVTSENYRHMMHMAEGAAKLGADILLVTPTPYVKQQQHDVYQMYGSLNNLGMPIIVYNIASRIGINIETSTLRRIAELENIIAVKEASGNLQQMKDVIETVVADRPEFSVLSGDDNMTFPLLKLGGDGVVSVVSNAFPNALVEMVEFYLKGDHKKAEFSDSFLQPFYKAAFVEGNPKSIKCFMREAGLPAGPTRPPLYAPKPETREYLAGMVAEARKMGLLEHSE